MLIYGIICKWRDINNPLLIKLMQNLHFMKMIKNDWNYRNQHVEEEDDGGKKKLLSFQFSAIDESFIAQKLYHLDNNTSVIIDHPKKNIKLFFQSTLNICKFYSKIRAIKMAFVSRFYLVSCPSPKTEMQKLLEIKSKLMRQLIDAFFTKQILVKTFSQSSS